MVFCNYKMKYDNEKAVEVTILILIDGFLQYYDNYYNQSYFKSHNPYFNRWFSAICSTALLCPSALKVTILILIDGFLQ